MISWGIWITRRSLPSSILRFGRSTVVLIVIGMISNAISCELAPIPFKEIEVVAVGFIAVLLAEEALFDVVNHGIAKFGF